MTALEAAECDECGHEFCYHPDGGACTATCAAEFDGGDVQEWPCECEAFTEEPVGS